MAADRRREQLAVVAVKWCVARSVDDGPWQRMTRNGARRCCMGAVAERVAGLVRSSLMGYFGRDVTVLPFLALR